MSSISLLDMRFDILSKATEFAGLPVEVARSFVREIPEPLEAVWIISSHLDTLEVKVLLESDELIDAIAEGLMSVHEVPAGSRRWLRDNTLETAIVKVGCR